MEVRSAGLFHYWLPGDRAGRWASDGQVSFGAGISEATVLEVSLRRVCTDDAPSPRTKDPGDMAAKQRIPVTCDDCYFRREELCALPGHAPCPTFRATTGGMLTPPPQPRLVPHGKYIVVSN